MFKKISVVLCAGLFATAFAAGCKKDKKDGEGAASAATCEGVGAKIATHMGEEMGHGDMSKLPPEAKKAMEDAMKKVPAAIIQACKDDKWSQEALDCAAKAKDPKTECEGKLTPEQEQKMATAAASAMGMGDMGAMMGEHDTDTVGVVGTTDGSGSASGTAAGSDTAPVAPGKFPATCQGLADRAMADMTQNLPPGAPPEIIGQFGTMLAKVCTDDKWAQDVLDCGVTAADPKKECKDKLTDEQKAHIDAEQDKLAEEMMKQMAAAGGGDDTKGGDMAAGGSSGVKECDEFMEAVKKIIACDKVPADQKTGLDQMVGAFSEIPEAARSMAAEQCKQGLTGMDAVLKTYGC